MDSEEGRKNIMQLVHDMGEVRAIAINNKEQLAHHTDCIGELYGENKTMLGTVSGLVVELKTAIKSIEHVGKSSVDRDKEQDKKDKDRRNIIISIIVAPIIITLINIIIAKFF